MPAEITVRVVSACTVPPRTATTMRCTPGSVPGGMVTTVRKLPEASAVVVPSSTGVLNSRTSSGLLAGNPLPKTVTF